MKAKKDRRSNRVALDDGLERLMLTEAEHAGLIRGSSRDRWLECAFGPGWVALLPVESNRWAFNIIKDVRS